jgi:hypothetical protein
MISIFNKQAFEHCYGRICETRYSDGKSVKSVSFNFLTSAANPRLQENVRLRSHLLEHIMLYIIYNKKK